MKIDTPAHVESKGGKNAAMLFPRRISPSVVGVASKGSNVFSYLFAHYTVGCNSYYGRAAAKTTYK